MTIERILFVELLGGIGDLIFAIPAIDAIKRTYPVASLDVLTFAPGGDLLLGDPRVREAFSARRGRGSRAAAALRADVTAMLDGGCYDLVVSDTRHSGIHEVIDASDVPWKVTQLWTGAGQDEQIARLFLRRLREEKVVDDVTASLPARLHLAIDERQEAELLWFSLDVAPEHTVILNPHSGMAVKRWPTYHFVTLGQEIQADGWNVAVLAGDCPDLAWSIARLIPNARFLPKVALRLTAACLERAALVVSGDSGIAHLASAVDTPVVAIYGPTWAGRYGVTPPSANLQSPFDCPELNPMNFTLQRCWREGRCIFPGKENCCEDVAPADALEVVRRLLGRGTSPHPVPRSIGRRERGRTNRAVSSGDGEMVEGGEASA